MSEVAARDDFWSPAALRDAHLVLAVEGISPEDTTWFPLERLRRGPIPLGVLSSTVNSRTLAVCIEIGASFLLDVSSTLDELVGAINEVMTDREKVESETRAALAGMQKREAEARLVRRSPFDLLDAA